MKIECQSCHKKYEVPDDRLPLGKEVSFPCQACKQTIKLDLRAKAPQGGAAASTATGKEFLTGEPLKQKILKSVHDLPPMPQTVHRAREIIADANSSFKDLAKVLETDPGLATKVLKMANSSYYGLSGEVSSLQHASVVLGHKTIGELMTVAGTSAILGKTLPGYGLDAGDLWQHSMGVAFGSRIIAKKKRPALVDDAFAAGIIHDSGKLILDKYILERKESFEKFMAGGENGFLAAEKAILGFDHAEIAYDVCRSWHVPEALTVAIRYHHCPSESGGNELACIVHIADSMAIMTGLGTGIDGMMYRMDQKAMESLGLKEDDMPEVMTELAESVEQIAMQ